MGDIKFAAVFGFCPHLKKILVGEGCKIFCSMTFDPKWQQAVTLSGASDWNGLSLKVPGPISQNGDIYSNDASSPKKSSVSNFC